MQDKSVRLARLDEAEAIANLVRGSISELCFDNHDGDDATIDRWLDNKTKDNIAAWIAALELSLFVIGCSTSLAAAGSCRDDGVILMNYVSPFYRFQGLSARMIDFLEASLVACGLTTTRLVSTRTAISFYENRGWQRYGDPITCMGVTGQPMKKNLNQSVAELQTTN